MERNFNPKLRKLIRDSKLNGIDKNIRRNIIENTPEYEISIVNDKVVKIFGTMNFDHFYRNFDFHRLGSYEDFLNISSNDCVIKVFSGYKRRILIKAISFCSTFNDFIKICEEENSRSVLKKGIINNIDFFCNIYSVSNVNEFIDLVKDKDIKYFINNVPKKNLNYLFKRFNIKNSQDFEYFLKNKFFEHIKKISKDIDFDNMIENIDYLMKLDKSEYLTYEGNNINFTNNNKFRVCPEADIYNNSILEGKLNEYTKFNINGELIGILKSIHEGEKSFLSLKNVFLEDGTLLFFKGMIYYFEGFYIFTSYEEVEISDLEKLEINPLRMINIEDFDELVDSFVEKNT